MYLDNPVNLLRQLKGAPLAVLLAMYWTRMTVSADWLVTVTGYSDKPVTQALKLLTAYGWTVKSRGGWSLAEGVQLPLMSGESEKFRSCSSSSDKEVTNLTIEEQEENRNNSDSFVANYRALKGYGVREPALSRLAALDHVSPDFVNAHVKRVRSERGNLGTAIYRIEHGWEAPLDLEIVEHGPRYTEGKFAGYFGGTSSRDGA